MRRLNELGTKIEVPEVVHIDQVGDIRCAPCFRGGYLGLGRATQGSGYSAEQVAAKIRPNPNPADDLNAIKQSGAIEEVAGIDQIKPGPRGGVDHTRRAGQCAGQFVQCGL